MILLGLVAMLTSCLFSFSFFFSPFLISPPSYLPLPVGIRRCLSTLHHCDATPDWWRRTLTHAQRVKKEDSESGPFQIMTRWMTNGAASHNNRTRADSSSPKPWPHQEVLATNNNSNNTDSNQVSDSFLKQWRLGEKTLEKKTVQWTLVESVEFPSTGKVFLSRIVEAATSNWRSVLIDQSGICVGCGADSFHVQVAEIWKLKQQVLFMAC